jgi:hypothetical protein
MKCRYPGLFLGLGLSFLVSLSLGCGGGGSASPTPVPTATPSPAPSPTPTPTPTPTPSPTPVPTTRARFTIQWPERGRALAATAAALSAKIAVADTPVSLTLNRESAPAAYTQTAETSESLPVGSHTVTVQFFADANATGALVAEASAVATLEADGSGLDTVTVGGKIATLELAAPSPLIVGDTSAVLTATARNASGQLLAVTPGSFRFGIASGDAVQLTSDLRLLAVKPGIAEVVALLDTLSSPARRVEVLGNGGVDLEIR